MSLLMVDQIYVHVRIFTILSFPLQILHTITSQTVYKLDVLNSTSLSKQQQAGPLLLRKNHKISCLHFLLRFSWTALKNANTVIFQMKSWDTGKFRTIKMTIQKDLNVLCIEQKWRCDDVIAKTFQCVHFHIPQILKTER